MNKISSFFFERGGEERGRGSRDEKRERRRKEKTHLLKKNSNRHWAGGAIGYFPTYVLGAIAAAQLDEAARAELSAAGIDFDAEVASGREGFSKLREWLRVKVHSRGSLPESLDALMVEATGCVVSGFVLGGGGVGERIQGRGDAHPRKKTIQNQATT